MRYGIASRNACVGAAGFQTIWKRANSGLLSKRAIAQVAFVRGVIDEYVSSIPDHTAGYRAPSSGLLRQYPIDKLPDLLVTQAGLRPHDEPVAPVSRTASSNHCGQALGLLRIESIALRYRAE